jgi:hypothetical protein
VSGEIDRRTANFVDAVAKLFDGNPETSCIFGDVDIPEIFCTFLRTINFVGIRMGGPVAGPFSQCG